MSNALLSVPKGSLLICPELATTSAWARVGGRPYVGVIGHYQASILTALFLNKLIIAPSVIPDLLKDAQEHELLELMQILSHNNNLLYISTVEDAALASEMARADEAAALQKGISTGTFAYLPGTDIRCALSSHHSGTDCYQASIGNFILLTHQLYECEYLDPVSNSEFSIEKFLIVKDYLWKVQQAQSTKELSSAREVLVHRLKQMVQGSGRVWPE
jgi:hypothetical protein